MIFKYTQYFIPQTTTISWLLRTPLKKLIINDFKKR